MNSADKINTQPLKHYATVFLVYLWIKRILMVLIRAVLVAGLLLILVGAFGDSGHRITDKLGSLSFSFDFGSDVLIPVFFFYAVPFGIMLMSMTSILQKFAKENNFTYVQQISYPPNPNSPSGKMIIPSFRGKALRISLLPIIGNFAGRPFGFFTRQYKEGGIIRWRERKMDTILWFDLPMDLPHILIDAKKNEKARRSNMTSRDSDMELSQFEGPLTDMFNVFVSHQNRITALQLFTPDVLLALYERLPLVDIEIKGRTMWLVWRYGVLNDKLAKEFFAGAEVFLAEFMGQAETYDSTKR